jgi:hypothetical protein
MTTKVYRTDSYRIAVGAEGCHDKEVPQWLQHKEKWLSQCINSEVHNFEETSTILQMR